ncbi:hypothetical protein SVEN_5681 [Streptomyces venezuelae ATCC 10712]|uniref:Uncharacterized protein n=1 Tax=Streptomyces venezuelae (strain ATCC 10712 / CBS 650.69 / DSM 40230 / JCM 4526 / NBRC 13096 / PD 04745) TaxID=953739 RepID=F2R9C4_STRVP|nr:hypothetical protein SVEN_5681 [Streptomyces venezuelae ATCC 10712]
MAPLRSGAAVHPSLSEFGPVPQYPVERQTSQGTHRLRHLGQWSPVLAGDVGSGGNCLRSVLAIDNRAGIDDSLECIPNGGQCLLRRQAVEPVSEVVGEIALERSCSPRAHIRLLVSAR